MHNLTKKDLVDLGVPLGKEIGTTFQKIKGLDREAAIKFIKTGELPERTSRKVEMIEGTAWHWLCNNPCVNTIPSREKFGSASNSERRRWLESGSVIINRIAIGPYDKMPNELRELVFFPKGSRITML